MDSQVALYDIKIVCSPRRLGEHVHQRSEVDVLAGFDQPWITLVVEDVTYLSRKKLISDDMLGSCVDLQQ